MTIIKISNIKIRYLFLLLLFFLPNLVSADVNFRQVSTNRIKDIGKGKNIQVQGQVIVLPGNLGSQFFYINGLQIYCYRKEFPKLAIGDEIEVKGVITESRGEKRIKIRNKNDIKIIERGLNVEPKLVDIDDINLNLVGKLIKVSGRVIEKTGSKMFIGNDTTNKEIIIYLKKYTGINLSKIKEGDRVAITGILSQNYNELRLLPRNNNDIKLIEQDFVNNASNKNTKIVLLTGETGSLRVNRLQYYLILSTCIIGFILLIIIFLKQRFLK